MSDFSHELLVYGIAAAKSGEKEEAISKLERVLSLDSSEEERLDACYWLAMIHDAPELKRKYLEEVLAADPHHMLARREWLILNGQLAREDVIDPNQIAPGGNGAGKPELDRFTCPQCGGRMVYSPDGSSLVCEFCELRKSQAKKNPLSEQDFLLSMATIKGHTQPEGQNSFVCQGCGASFLIANQSLSMSCPYCHSVYVVDLIETHRQAAPSAIFPARVSLQAALARLDSFRAEREIPVPDKPIELQGIYLPAWWFALGGEVTFRYQLTEKKRTAPQLVNSSRPILRSDVMIPACLHHVHEMEGMIASLQFDEMIAFTTDYLADWWAETYQVSVADASLKARQLVYLREKREIQNDIPSYAEDLNFSSHALAVDSYQLVLLPAWLGKAEFSGRPVEIFIDALTGSIQLKGWDQPKPQSFWSRLLNL